MSKEILNAKLDGITCGRAGTCLPCEGDVHFTVHSLGHPAPTIPASIEKKCKLQNQCIKHIDGVPQQKKQQPTRPSPKKSALTLSQTMMSKFGISYQGHRALHVVPAI